MGTKKPQPDGGSEVLPQARPGTKNPWDGVEAVPLGMNHTDPNGIAKVIERLKANVVEGNDSAYVNGDEFACPGPWLRDDLREVLEYIREKREGGT